MTPDQITTIITSLFGYGGVAIALERLRREFAAYKDEQKKEHADHRARLEALEIHRA